MARNWEERDYQETVRRHRQAGQAAEVRGVRHLAREAGGPAESWHDPDGDDSDSDELYPTDLFTAPEPASRDPGGWHVSPIDGEALEDSRKLHTGWSVARQRLFLEALSESGSVHSAAAAARLSARSAYRLRARSPAFARAWNTAQSLAVGRLSALAFDRAIHGRLEQRFEDGVLVSERRVPSDRMLMWLLSRLDPARYALPWERRSDEAADPQGDALTAFPDQLDALTDLVTTPPEPSPGSAEAFVPSDSRGTQASDPTEPAPAPRTWGCHILPRPDAQPPSPRPLGTFAAAPPSEAAPSTPLPPARTAAEGPVTDPPHASLAERPVIHSLSGDGRATAPPSHGSSL